MSLLLPLALLGLLTLPAILLLHLLRNRREELAIPSLRLWRGLQKQKQGGLPRHIPLSLLLLLQLVAATALTLALARPAFSFMLDQPRHTIFILDMTTSMTALDGRDALLAGDLVSRFEQAKQIIQNHLETLDDNDRVSVISLAPRPEILLTGGAAQLSTLLLALDNLTPGGTGAALSQALTLANGLVDPDQHNRIVVLSDGNYLLEPAALPELLAPTDWQFVPDEPGQAGNQALLDFSARRLPDDRQRIFVRVVNYSDEPVNRTVQLLVDGAPAGQQTVALEPEADTPLVWTVPARAETVAVELLEPDLLPLDNRAELLLLNPASHRVLLVSAEPETLARAFAAQPDVSLTIAGGTDAAAQVGADIDLIVFDGLPPDMTGWPRGNSLVVNPPQGHSLLPSSASARSLRPDAATASSLLSGIDLSGVYFNGAPQLAAPDWAAVDLWAAGEESALPLIFHGRPTDSSQVMVWNFDLANSNLPGRLALPLLTANALSVLLAPSPPPALPVGEPLPLAGNFDIAVPDGQRLSLQSTLMAAPERDFGHTRQPGLYRIYNEQNELVAGFAVHAGSPLESDLRQGGQSAAAEAVSSDSLFAPAPEIMLQEYWPWLAGLALLVITVEGWLAWRK